MALSTPLFSVRYDRYQWNPVTRFSWSECRNFQQPVPIGGDLNSHQPIDIEIKLTRIGSRGRTSIMIALRLLSYEEISYKDGTAPIQG